MMRYPETTNLTFTELRDYDNLDKLVIGENSGALVIFDSARLSKQIRLRYSAIKALVNMPEEGVNSDGFFEIYFRDCIEGTPDMEDGKKKTRDKVLTELLEARLIREGAGFYFPTSLAKEGLYTLSFFPRINLE